jgi:monoamine oxidase
MAEMPYFPAVRFLLETKVRFWERDGLSGTARTDDPAEIWDGAYDRAGDAGLLAVTAGGQIGDRVNGLTDDQTVKFGADLVARSFPKLRAEFRKGTSVRWARESWSRGGFLVCRPGQMTTLLPQLARAEGRFHFAGEHTSSWMSWMEGAVESGERAAREILGAE